MRLESKKARVVAVVAATCTLILAQARPATAMTVDVRHSGAKGDGQTVSTRAIQKAIDRCAAAGGGTVHFPPGKWLSGTLVLKSHVTLHLEAGATLLGSTDLAHYPEKAPRIPSYTDNYVSRSLIYAEDAKHVAIRGRGTIDGQGRHFFWKSWDKRDRPFLIRMIACTDVLVEDVRLRNSAMWMQHYLVCERLRLRGMDVFNHATYNNDGVDIDGCRDVSISGCMFDTDDDALCLKSTQPRPTENVTISNCILSSHCTALKTGTESTGGFRNITVNNCVIVSPRYSKALWGFPEGRCGIALELVDGGTLENITISNVVIDGVSVPLFMRLGNRGRPYKDDVPKPPTGTFRNVVLSNIRATGASRIGVALAGIPGHPIEHVTLRDIRLEFAGGGTAKQARRKIEERVDAYPEADMFGTLPAYGLYGRHLKNLRLENVQLVTAVPDARPATAFEDVDGLWMDGQSVKVPASQEHQE